MLSREGSEQPVIFWAVDYSLEGFLVRCRATGAPHWNAAK